MSLTTFIGGSQRLLAVCGILVLAACNDKDEPTFNADIPDLTQTRVAGRTHGDGQMYCAPVAVSNSLAWLLDENDQISVAKKLASQSYMNTSLKNGTGTVGVLRGVAKYLGSKGIQPSSLLYQGWRKHLKQYRSGEKQPQIRFIKHHVGRKRAAWINIGWYRKEGRNYRRVGGHWVTLVGHSKTEAHSFYLNDPSPRSGMSPNTNKVLVAPIRSGKMIGKKTGLPVVANGYFQITSGLNLPGKADVAIIDGVVGLEL